MQTIQDILQLSSSFLEQKGILQPRREAEEVLSLALNLSRLDIYLNFDKPLVEEELLKCREILKRKALGEPSAYIKGHISFFDCQIAVTPDVLIPRVETELLVDRICKEISNEKRIWDLCTGSGCIAIAIKKRISQLEVFASDICPKALAVAKNNAKDNGVVVHFLEGDFLSVIREKVDLIVCNPPYVSDEEFQNLNESVASFEPKIALVAPNDGLEFYMQLAKFGKDFLLPGGKIWLEIGYLQGSKVKDLFDGEGWHNTLVIKDLSSHDRFFAATRD